MLESEILKDPVRKQKFTTNLTEDRGGKKKSSCSASVGSPFYLNHPCLFLISSVLFFEGELPCHVLLI